MVAKVGDKIFAFLGDGTLGRRQVRGQPRRGRRVAAASTPQRRARDGLHRPSAAGTPSTSAVPSPTTRSSRRSTPPTTTVVAKLPRSRRPGRPRSSGVGHRSGPGCRARAPGWSFVTLDARRLFRTVAIAEVVLLGAGCSPACVARARAPDRRGRSVQVFARPAARSSIADLVSIVLVRKPLRWGVGTVLVAAIASIPPFATLGVRRVGRARVRVGSPRRRRAPRERVSTRAGIRLRRRRPTRRYRGSTRCGRYPSGPDGRRIRSGAWHRRGAHRQSPPRLAGVRSASAGAHRPARVDAGFEPLRVWETHGDHRRGVSPRGCPRHHGHPRCPRHTGAGPGNRSATQGRERPPATTCT